MASRICIAIQAAVAWKTSFINPYILSACLLCVASLIPFSDGDDDDGGCYTFTTTRKWTNLSFCTVNLYDNLLVQSTNFSCNSSRIAKFGISSHERLLYGLQQVWYREAVNVTYSMQAETSWRQLLFLLWKISPIIFSWAISSLTRSNASGNIGVGVVKEGQQMFV